MTRLAVRAVLVSTTVFGLAACEDGINLGQGGGESADSTAPASIAAREGGARDVERPDLFIGPLEEFLETLDDGFRAP